MTTLEEGRCLSSEGRDLWGLFRFGPCGSSQPQPFLSGLHLVTEAGRKPGPSALGPHQKESSCRRPRPGPSFFAGQCLRPPCHCQQEMPARSEVAHCPGAEPRALGRFALQRVWTVAQKQGLSAYSAAGLWEELPGRDEPEVFSSDTVSSPLRAPGPPLCLSQEAIPSLLLRRPLQGCAGTSGQKPETGGGGGGGLCSTTVVFLPQLTPSPGTLGGKTKSLAWTSSIRHNRKKQVDSGARGSKG